MATKLDKETGDKVSFISVIQKLKELIYLNVLTSTMRHSKNYSKNFGQTTEQLIFVFG
jgi:hypothetical protein